MSQRQLLRPETSVSGASIVVSASLFLTALLGAGQALLLVIIVGEGNRTDAFLAAYSLYVVFAILGGSMRASVVPLLGATDSEDEMRRRANELLSRILMMAVAILVVLVAISVPAGQLLTLGLPADARWTAVGTLLVLAPAASLQVYAAAQAAVLIAARRYPFSSALYVVSGAIALGCSALGLVTIGVLGAAIGLLVGAVALAGGHGAYLSRHGVRPHARRPFALDPRQREVAMVLLSAGSLSVALQLDLAIALGSLSGDPGAITVYSYAFFGISLLLSISSFSIALVTMPDLVSDFARRGVVAAGEYFQRVPRYVFAVLAPALVAFATHGKPLLEWVLDGVLSQGSIDLLYDIGLVLALMAVPTALLFLAGSVTLALGLARRFLPVAAATIVLQIAFTLPLSSVSPVAVAAGHAANMTITCALLLRAIFGPGWLSVLGRAMRGAAPAFALSSVFVVLRLPLGSDPGTLATLGSLLASIAAYVLLARVLWPTVSRAFFDLARHPLRRLRRTQRAVAQ